MKLNPRRSEGFQRVHWPLMNSIMRQNKRKKQKSQQELLL